MRTLSAVLCVVAALSSACKARQEGAQVRDETEATDINALLSELAAGMSADLNVLYAGDLPQRGHVLALDGTPQRLSQAELDALKKKAADANQALKRAQAEADTADRARAEALARLMKKLGAARKALEQIEVGDTERYAQGLDDLQKVMDEMVRANGTDSGVAQANPPKPAVVTNVPAAPAPVAPTPVVPTPQKPAEAPGSIAKRQRNPDELRCIDRRLSTKAGNPIGSPFETQADCESVLDSAIKGFVCNALMQGTPEYWVYTVSESGFRLIPSALGMKGLAACNDSLRMSTDSVLCVQTSADELFAAIRKVDLRLISREFTLGKDLFRTLEECYAAAAKDPR